MWLPVVECTDQLSGYNWSNVESGIKHQLSQKKPWYHYLLSNNEQSCVELVIGNNTIVLI